MHPPRFRLAPSPTGYLHLGNAWAFFLCWLAARHKQGTIVLRIEDVDTARCRQAYADAILEDLAWLGLTWDEGPVAQHPRIPRYTAVLEHLVAAGHAYPCWCSRKDLQELASAPHGETPVYPGRCRSLSEDERTRRAALRPPAFRLILPDTACHFDDAVLGPIQLTPAACGGDFPIRRADGLFAYQLAVAVDDLDGGITTVVRGADLLSSTPRQQAIFHYLNAPLPRYAHVPLLLDATGQRLAKRHSALSLRALRHVGVRPQAVIGLLAWLAGLRPSCTPCGMEELIADFAWAALPCHPVHLPPDPLGMLQRQR